MTMEEAKCRDGPAELEKGSSAKASASTASTLVVGLNFVALLTCMFSATLDLTIISTAIPAITTQFNSLNDIGWYASAFFLTVAVFQSVWGKVYKYFNLKWSFLFALLIFELGTLSSAVATNSAGFIAGRAISGIGGGGLIGGTYIIVAHIVSPAKVPIYYGLTGIVFVLASLCGPLIGGAFTSDVTWRWCFYINLPLGGFAAVVLLLLLRLPESAKPARATAREILLQLDVPGATLIIGSLVCYLLVLEWGGITVSWSNSRSIGLLVGWIIMLICFVVVEFLQGERAMIAPRHLKHRGILVCCILVLFLSAANYLRMYFLPIYFQAIHGSSPVSSGYYLLALMIPTSICTIVAGVLLASIGYYKPFIVCGAAVVTVGSGLMYTYGLDFSVGKVIGYQIIVGLGDGFAAQIPVTAVQAFVSRDDIAVVTSTVMFFQLICGVVGVAAGESIFSNLLLQSLTKYAPAVDWHQVLTAGAYDLRAAVTSADQLYGVKQAYMVGIKAVMILTIALSGASFVVALFAPWMSIKGKTGPDSGSASGDDDSSDVSEASMKG